MPYLSFPSADDLLPELREIRALATPDNPIDVRLQVRKRPSADAYMGPHWQINYGDPGYDTDHNGYWGAGIVGDSDSDAELTTIAEKLIAEALDDGLTDGAESAAGDFDDAE